MEIRPHRVIKRKITKKINVGTLSVGGDSIISVQSMTNTLTTDIKATIKQVNEIHSEGADIVRVSCPDESSSKALKEIIKTDEEWEKILTPEQFKILTARQHVRERIGMYMGSSSREEIERFVLGDKYQVQTIMAPHMP